MIADSTKTTKAIVEEICPAPDPVEVYSRLARRPYCLFLDSALANPNLGRYSFVTCDPFEFLDVSSDGSDGLTELAEHVGRFTESTIPGLPPFQGGAAGLFSYDLCHSLERLPRPRFDEFETPALAVGLYDTVVAFDHQTNQAWIISQGFPEYDPGVRYRRANERLNQFRSWIHEPAGQAWQRTGQADSGSSRFTNLSRREIAPQFATSAAPDLTSDFSPGGYQKAIQRVIDYICSGDAFQVNLSQRLLHPATDNSVALYLRLRERNPATFAAYFDLGEFQIVSASPERFVHVRDRQVEARPIKGTRGRTRNPEADLFAGDDLLQSEKDRAENVMIVDLLRNDLSRVCRADSVQVTDLCRLETYEYVQHLVSVVRGELRDNCSPIDLIRCAFPGGSITGAPKVRAMEIIAELEPTARGPYCGSLGYIGFDGTLDLSILIRTITAGRGWWQIPVGGGIVAQSEPQVELDETWQKAKGMIRALK